MLATSYHNVNMPKRQTSFNPDKRAQIYIKNNRDAFLQILQIHLHFYVLNKNTLQLYFWYTILIHVKSAILEQLMLCLMHFNCVEVELKSKKRYTEVYLIVLTRNYCKYTLGTL